jgi:hypothetical protein
MIFPAGRAIFWRSMILIFSASVACFGYAAVIPVYTTADNAAGSLRQAIQDASPGDTIVFHIPMTEPGYSQSANTYTIGLTSGELFINKNLTIDSGGQKIVLQRATANAMRIFNVSSSVVTMIGLTISNGFVDGGGIQNGGNLSLRNCAVINNQAGGAGGGIFNTGILRISNCTFRGNSAQADGSAIFNTSSGTLTVDNSTISANSSVAIMGGSGTGIRNASGGTATIRNSILVGNTSPTSSKDVFGTFVSEGYNLIGTTAGSSGFPSTGDQLGVTVAQVNLGPLQDNGGPSPTMRPLPGSVAIDQGKRGLDASGQPINDDQRGSPRPVDLAVSNAAGGDGSDIGAVEVGPLQTGPTFTVTNVSDHIDNDICTTDDCSLREAIAAANSNSNANTISFAAGLGPVIRTSGYVITFPLTIVGPGARQLTLDGADANRLLSNNSSNLNMTGVTLANGRTTNAVGAGISNNGGLAINNCRIIDCYASGSDQTIGNGGGLYNAAGRTAVVSNCSFWNNGADNFGGAVYTDGILTATNCTFFSNTALRGGGIVSRFAGGAAMLTIRNCTIANNLANDGASIMGGFGGGGLYCEGDAGQHLVGNTIIADNTSTIDPDLSGSYTSNGHNLIGNVGDGDGFSNGVNGDLVGTTASPLNAQFDSFADNGGPSETLSLLNTSPAINAGDNALASSTDQRGYGRAGIADMGAFEFAGTEPMLVPLISVVSSKVHGAQAFGINLPLQASVGLECRSGGARGDFTIVFTSASVLANVGNVSLTSGAATLAPGTGISSNDPHQYIVQLTNVVNAQQITLEVNEMTDSAGNNTPSIEVPVAFLLGDTTGSGTVNASDVTQTKIQSGQPVSASNFRTDVTVSGTINASDVSFVKARSGTSLPSEIPGLTKDFGKFKPDQHGFAPSRH